MEYLCLEEDIAVLVKALEGDGDDFTELDARLSLYPQDPRLHFMKGSLLAGKGRAIEAHASLSHAVELAPEFTWRVTSWVFSSLPLAKPIRRFRPGRRCCGCPKTPTCASSLKA